jgi:hypothetical protein
VSWTQVDASARRACPFFRFIDGCRSHAGKRWRHGAGLAIGSLFTLRRRPRPGGGAGRLVLLAVCGGERVPSGADLRVADAAFAAEHHHLAAVRTEAQAQMM